MSGVKRPREPGSFSPPSPPYQFAKLSEHSKRPIYHPSTPTSPPPHMSSGVAAPYASSTSTVSSVANTQFSSSTPPSTIARTSSFPIKDNDGDAVMSDNASSPDATKSTDRDTAMSNADSHTRTDHDRQGPGQSPLAGGSKVGLERLNADLGSLYKLCEQPVPMSRPHPSQNLISLYGLNRITDSVRRIDPITGEKINKLRKSYVGQIKPLGIAGKNKAAAEPNAQLMAMAYHPDEEWQNSVVFGKEISKGLEQPFLSKLDRAMRMAPCQLPSELDAKYKFLVGADEPAKGKADGSKNLKGPQQAGFAAKAGGRNSAAPSPALKPARPERTGTKRRYNESSFKGYGEGYADDDLDSSIDDDARSGHGGGGGIKKKRRKDFPINSSMGLDQRGNGYGNVGMVGRMRR